MYRRVDSTWIDDFGFGFVMNPDIEGRRPWPIFAYNLPDAFAFKVEW